MNKKLVALAVAAAFAAPVAMAELTLYGKVHADITLNDDGNNDEWSVNSPGSRLGFKGQTDLGNGMKAMFKYETTYDGLDNSTDTLGSPRNSYVGLSGKKGTLILGRHDTPAKMAFYAAGNDHLGDSIIDFNKIDKGYQFDLDGDGNFKNGDEYDTGEQPRSAGFTEKREVNSILYVSPGMSGFKIAAAGMPGESTANKGDALIDSYSVGLMYKGKGIQFGAGFENMAGAADSKMTQVGASYTFKNMTLGAQFENTKNYDNIADRSKEVMGVSAKAVFGKNALIANYSMQDSEGGALPNVESKNIGLAVKHTLSKRTNFYLAFNKQESDLSVGNDTESDNIALGMMHSF